MIKGKRGQVTIFVIIAILIIAAVGAVVYLRKGPAEVPVAVNQVENYFLQCLKDKAEEGIQILSAQGGYIKLPSFEAGSDYMPFSSQLDFFGSPVQYWFYVSGNNILKQKVPSIGEMQNQLADYTEENIDNCNLQIFEEQGYVITKGKSTRASVMIKENAVDISLDYDLTVDFAGSKTRISSHDVSVLSKLGKFYNIAKQIYNSEQEKLFLENYALDALTLYAPTSGVEVTCSPKIWQRQQIENDVKNALEANIQAIKVKGNYYKLRSQENKYFETSTDNAVEENINFLYSSRWPTRLELWSSAEGKDVLVAKPIGLQEGLGVLGFCFVQYQFVYDLAFPVLVQIYDSREMFQFPVVAIIQKNKVRNVTVSEPLIAESKICKYKNSELKVSTFNLNGKSIDTNLRFKCINEECEIGSTERGEVIAMVPQCINGFIIASAQGYIDSKYMLDTIESSIVNLYLKPLHKLNVKLNLQGIGQKAVVTFSSAEYTATFVYPEQNSVELAEGTYNVSVFVYKTGSIVLPEYKTTQCVEVPVPGLGIFGITREKCFDISFPSQTLSEVPVGGGNVQASFLESELIIAEEVSISAPVFTDPKTIEDLQEVYDLIEMGELSIAIR